MTVHATTIAEIAPYFRSKKIKNMQITESSIFVGLKRLRNLMYQCQFLMQKADRIIYGTPLMAASGKAIAAFVLAFTVSSKRLEYLEEAMGHFYVLKTDIEFCVMQNIIHFKKRDGDGGEKYESSKKIELLKLVAQIDNDMCKWRASLAKSKTVCG